MYSINNKIIQLLLTGLSLATPIHSFALPSGGPIPMGAALSQISVKQYSPSTLDLPPTAYLIPNSAFVILDPTKANATSMYGALFGPLGVLIHGEVGKSETSKTIDQSEQPLVDLADLVGVQLTKNSQPNTDNTSVFEITPSGWMFIKSAGDRGTLVIKLEVQWKDKSGDTKWRQEYYYNVLTDRSLIGTDGWFAAGTSALRQESELGVAKLIALFLNELSNAQTYSETEVKLGGCFPGVKKLTLLTENSDDIVIKVHGNRASGSSIQVVNRAQCTMSR